MGTCVTKPSPRPNLPLMIQTDPPPHPLPYPDEVPSLPSSPEDQSPYSEANVPFTSRSEDGEIRPFGFLVRGLRPGAEESWDEEDLGEESREEFVVSEDSVRLHSLSFSDENSLEDSLMILRNRFRNESLSSALSEHESLAKRLEKAEREVERLRKEIDEVRRTPAGQLVCAVCQDYRPRVLFRPCRHLCCCQECSERVRTCPMCREKIRKREEVYF